MVLQADWLLFFAMIVEKFVGTKSANKLTCQVAAFFNVMKMSLSLSETDNHWGFTYSKL